jgi:ribosomal protein L37AE/L43A
MYRNRSFIPPALRRLSFSLWFCVKCSATAPAYTKKGSALAALHLGKTVCAARVGLNVINLRREVVCKKEGI